MNRTLVAVVLGCLLATSPASGVELVPPWMDPDVLKAAESIGMTDEQMSRFRIYITEFTQDRLQAYVRLSRSNTLRDANRKVRGKTSSFSSAWTTQLLCSI